MRCILPFNPQYNDSLLLRPPSLSFRNNRQGFLLLGNLYSDVVFGHLRAASYGEKEWMEMKERFFYDVDSAIKNGKATKCYQEQLVDAEDCSDQFLVRSQKKREHSAHLTVRPIISRVG